MKKRFFLLLLLIFVLIPLQRSAALTVELVGDSSHLTTTADTHDIVFTIRFTSEPGKTHSLAHDTAAITIANANQIVENPQLLLITAPGSYDVTVTIPRSIIGTPGQHQFTFLGTDALDITIIYQIDFNVNIINPGDTVIEITLEVDGDITRELSPSEVTEITFPLKVTNDSEISNLQIDLEVEAVDWPGNLGPGLATLSLSSVNLTPDASEDLTLTILEDGIGESGTYFATVKATPAGGFAETVSVRINVFSITGLLLSSVDELTQTSTISDTEDVTYTLRLTNTGSDSDGVTFTIISELIQNATIEPLEVVLFPEGYEDLTLTIPRGELLDPGTYPVIVIANSQNDVNISASILTETTIIATDTLEQTENTENTEGTAGTVDTGLIDETDEIDEIVETEKTFRVIFSEFMFESEGGDDGLPQWVEVYNNSESEINLRGWKLQWKSTEPILLDVTITFQEDFIVPAQQARLIVSSLGQRTSGGNLSKESVYQLDTLHGEAFSQEQAENRNRVITRGGFSLKLLNKNDVLVDEIGTLNGDKQTWELHECLIDDVRSSLIRRFDEKIPRDGTTRNGWRRAYDTKRLIAGIYYGHSQDLGTPGYRRGKPLPVELSYFSARLVNNAVLINWTTESELNNAGFNILRSTSRTKNFRKINAKLIQGAGTTSKRNKYQFIDTTIKPNVAYYYRIEDIDLSGNSATLSTYQLRGVFSPTGKRILPWGELKHVK